MNNEFPKVKHKVIDGHLHIEAWTNSNGENFIGCFDEYKRNMGISALNLAALPSGYGADVTSNIMCAVYKLVDETTYAHGGLLYDQYPLGESLPEGMDFVTQLNELMEIGFDGVKMLEGKPTLNKKVGKNLLHKEYDKFFAEAEKQGTHILFHVNDPKEFWDKDKVSQDTIDHGWFYGDGTFATHEELYRQAYAILEKHPKLCVTFAHFFFKSETPEDLVELFEKYPNVAVDLTPGWEMYISFYENKEYYKNFFTKYSKRIELGTDSSFPSKTESFMWLMDRVYRYVSCDDVVKAFDDRYESGLNLPQNAIEDIVCGNFERRVGKAPKKINKDALVAYHNKYKHLMTEGDIQRVDELFEKYL
ncbi:MAG: amidohydrolase family protein [Clostridia bacterium]|nr:amidohydrolase family protein [Clostridia bacterium]